MVQRRTVTVAPTLVRMAEIYSLARTGGRRSPRFAAYMAQVEQHWGLAAFNPMAGEQATAAVDALITLDAEEAARESAQKALDLCEWRDPITLAVVVPTPGMWTDRLATEARHRTVADRRPEHGEIQLWSTDVPRMETILMESAAEAVRTIWTSRHGLALTLHAVLAREGLAYAFNPGDLTEHTNDAPVIDAIEVLGDTSTEGDMIAVLYGDAAAIALGYTPLGIEDRAGQQFAVRRARRLVARLGMAGALRAGASAISWYD